MMMRQRPLVGVFAVCVVFACACVSSCLATEATHTLLGQTDVSELLEFQHGLQVTLDTSYAEAVDQGAKLLHGAADVDVSRPLSYLYGEHDREEELMEEAEMDPEAIALREAEQEEFSDELCKEHHYKKGELEVREEDGQTVGTMISLLEKQDLASASLSASSSSDASGLQLQDSSPSSPFQVSDRDLMQEDFEVDNLHHGSSRKHRSLAMDDVMAPMHVRCAQKRMNKRGIHSTHNWAQELKPYALPISPFFPCARFSFLLCLRIVAFVRIIIARDDLLVPSPPKHEGSEEYVGPDGFEKLSLLPPSARAGISSH